MRHILGWFWLLLRWPVLLLGGWLWARAAQRFLPAKPGRLARLARLLLFCASMGGPLWIGDENLLFFLAAFLAVFLLCSQGVPLARAVVGVVFYLLLSSVGMLMDTLCNRLPLAWGDWPDLAGALCKALAACLTLLLARRLLPQGRPRALPVRLWGLCALLSCAPLMVVVSFSLWNSFGRMSMDRGQYRIAYTVLPFVFLSALALLVAIAVLSRQQELEQAARLAQMRALYHQGLQTRETRLRTLRHDLRNHLSAVQGLLDRGETEQAKGYLQQLNDSPALHGAARVCQNELANVVLACKQEEMERLGLRANLRVTLPRELPIADPDLCALLGNALDNAMEAAQNAPDRTVLVQARADRGMLMLRVENGFCGVRAPAGGRLPTSKTDAAAHGFGLPGMREIAERYGGTLETRVQADRFELVACLPLAPAPGEG